MSEKPDKVTKEKKVKDGKSVGNDGIYAGPTPKEISGAKGPKICPTCGRPL